MIPVTQRVTGYPYGECVRASYASLFEMPIEEVPRFDPARFRELGYEKQLDMERDWLATMGFDLVGYEARPGGRIAPLGEPGGSLKFNLPDELIGRMPPVYHLISGLSSRGFGHRCVGFAGKLAHDPHPSRDGLLTTYSIGFVVPL